MCQMALECSIPQILKLWPTSKMGFTIQYLQSFHLESIKMNNKIYNDPHNNKWIVHLSPKLYNLSNTHGISHYTTKSSIGQ